MGLNSRSTSVLVGNIIYLNGTSSAGKSSLAAALQALLPAPYLHVGLDRFNGMFPPQYVAVQPFDQAVPPQAHEGLVLFHDTQDGRLRLEPHHGPAWERLADGFRQSIRALALTGNNLIVDDVLTRRDALLETVVALAGLPALFIKVACPVDELERREQARGDRLLGLARWQHEQMADWAEAEYDLVVDTSRHGPDECARQVAQLVADPPSLTCVGRLGYPFV
jgi:chloramphenicol 3-O phosphotransferase